MIHVFNLSNVSIADFEQALVNLDLQVGGIFCCGANEIPWRGWRALEGAPDGDVPGAGSYEVLEGPRADLPGVGLGVPSGEGAIVKGEGDCPGFPGLEKDLLESLEVLDGLPVHARAWEADVCLGGNSMEEIIS